MGDTWSNVVLLSADALRADHLSCHGYRRNTSPVLDDLADESTRFTNAYSVSSHTREAVPGLLTGKYPDVSVDPSYRLATDTVASVLSDSGYATGGFHSNPFVSRAYGFGRGFDEFDDDLHLGKHRLVALAQRAIDKVRNRHYARASDINERSLSWLDSLESDKQFFLWNHYMDTHGPYEPPGEYATRYTDTEVTAREAQSLYRRAVGRPGSITDDERRLLVDLYDAEISYTDNQVGEFLRGLRKRDLLDDTLLIFTSDHGEAFGEHGYYEHPRRLHSEVTRVPLFVRSPRQTEETIDTPASTLDVVATIEEGTGHDVSGDGMPLLELGGDDRAVFLQARGEDDKDHLRRYAARTRTEACYCERDTETGATTFTDCSSRPLRERLRDHVDARADVDHDGSAGERTGAGGDIDRRLSALGYKE